MSGFTVDHLITLAQRGLPDSAIRLRLERDADLVLLTQDAEFLNLPGRFAGKVIVSHVSQARPLAERVAIWMPVLEAFLRDPPPQSSFELSDAGELLPWEDVKS